MGLLPEFLLVVFAAAVAALVVWRLPDGLRTRGLASAWRWIVVAVTLYMCYDGYDVFPHFKIISPLLWVAAVVLMCCALFSAARQDCRPVWGRLLACLFLDMAIYVDLLVISS